MKLVKFPFLDQLGECPIELNIKKGDALFVDGDETAGAWFVLNRVMERSWLIEKESFNSGFETAKNTELSVGSVF